MRAVYWRIRNSADLPSNSIENYSSPQTLSAYRLEVDRLLETNGHPAFDCVPFLEELLSRYEYQSDPVI